MVIRRSVSYAWMGIVMIIASSSFVLITIRPKAGLCFVLPFIIIACFLLGAVIRSLWDDKPQIIINEEGIVIRGEPKILWHTIKAARSEHWPKGLIFIVLEFVNGKEQRFIANGFNVGYWQILAYIKTYLAEFEITSTSQANLIQFGKYQSNNMSTSEDFAIAEWHPTDKDLNGE